eukprot:3971627-Prymnesium_polylepis.1
MIVGEPISVPEGTLPRAGKRQRALRLYCTRHVEGLTSRHFFKPLVYRGPDRGPRQDRGVWSKGKAKKGG